MKLRKTIYIASTAVLTAYSLGAPLIATASTTTGTVPTSTNTTASFTYDQTTSTGLAAFVASTPTTPATVTTPASIPGTTVTPPTVPGTVSQPATNPGNGDGSVTGSIGNLTIDFVPNFDFGTHTIPTATTTYNATAQSATVTAAGQVAYEPNFAQVSDNTSTNDGWVLQAQVTKDFTNGTNPTTLLSLSGASLSYNSVTAVNDNNVNAPVATASQSLLTSGPVTVASANAGQDATTAQPYGTGANTIWFGSGAVTTSDGTLTPASLTASTGGTLAVGDSTDTANVNRVTNSAIQLTVPASTQLVAGTYSATITWTLTQGTTGGVQ